MMLDLSTIIWKVVPATFAFIAGWAVKTLLDLDLIVGVLRAMTWLPTRGLFRAKVYRVAGKWYQQWETNSDQFRVDESKRSNATVSQFFTYWLADFVAKDRKYRAIGRVTEEHLVGRWYDIEDPKGYYGTFQLAIVSQIRLEGLYIGHSKQSREIKADRWVWDRLDGPATNK